LAVQPQENTKRIRKPSARAAPVTPPSRSRKRTRKQKTAAAPQPNKPSPAATESVIVLGSESDGPEEGGVGPEPSPEPEKAPHPVHFQCSVLLDGKLIKTFGKTWEINSVWHTGYIDFDKLAKDYIKGYMEKRGGVVDFYKGPWRAYWGAIKDPTQHDIDNKEDWDSLEENLRHRALTGGGIRNAARVDIKAHFKTRGNADSSPLPSTQVDISVTQTRAKSKAKPQTIRQGSLVDSDPAPELQPQSRQGSGSSKDPFKLPTRIDQLSVE